MGTERQQTLLIRNALAHLESVYFVQVGSNDGVQGDPINSLIVTNDNWRGIFIEPVPNVFERLKKNYSQCTNHENRFIFENVAIAQQEGEMPFYFVPDSARDEIQEELPFWFDQLGSFNRNNITRVLNGALEPFIVETSVRCIPLMDLLKNNNIDKIDLLHIDAEGSDYRILRNFNLEQYLPTVILVEVHLMTQKQQDEIRELLTNRGYRISVVDYDFLAQREVSPSS